MSDSSVQLAKLESRGAGQKEIVWDPDNNWQKIAFNFEVDIELDVAYTARRGDILQYEIVELRGTIRFWGSAEDHFYGTYILNIGDTHSYKLRNPPDGLLEYSQSQGRVTYVQCALSTGTGSARPYFIQFFGLAHPYTARLWVDLPEDWYFDDIYDSCKPGMGVDMTDSVMISPGADLSYDSAKLQYNAAYPGSWRMVALDAGFQADFELEAAPGSATLVIDHLSSATSAPGCPGGGYAPVDIVVNGQALASCYDPAQNHGGSHGFVTDRWEVGHLLRPGPNRIQLRQCATACTHYWIRYLYIDAPVEDCASCKLDVPKLFALIIGVDDVNVHGKKGSLDAQAVFDQLK